VSDKERTFPDPILGRTTGGWAFVSGSETTQAARTSPGPAFGVTVRSVSMASPWGEEAVWASVTPEQAQRVWEVLGPPDLPFVDNAEETDR
jgi:hypothetical protein